MVEPAIAMLIGITVGGLGGFIRSVIGWLEGSEGFNSRKNVSTTLTAVLVGIVTTGGFLATEVIGPETTDTQLVVLYITILGAATGFGSIGRSAVGAANTSPAQAKS
jgi:hypothetical protein